MFKLKNKKVIVTGHTGFKGSWLTLWLLNLGANIVGVSNNIPTKPSLFKILKLRNKIKHIKLDIRNYKKLNKIINKEKPDFIFHLAAQAIVKKSYEDPIFNWETNTLGTINILQSLRRLKKKCIASLVTSDKSYKNFEIKRGYTEKDILGGDDPYSASKASAELAINSYFKSYFFKHSKIRLASVRAGNVIGGGDWSENRLIPDCVKSWSKSKTAILRNPNSTRPWQHVIEAIRGYILLAIKLSKDKDVHGESFNFGPINRNNYKVISLVREFKKNWSNIKWKIAKPDKKILRESKLLKINSNKAKKILNWECVLNFKTTSQMVSDWYKKYYKIKKINMFAFSTNQINEYLKLINK